MYFTIISSFTRFLSSKLYAEQTCVLFYYLPLPTLLRLPAWIWIFMAGAYISYPSIRRIDSLALMHMHIKINPTKDMLFSLSFCFFRFCFCSFVSILKHAYRCDSGAQPLVE